MKKKIIFPLILLGLLASVPLFFKIYHKKWYRPYLTVIGFADMSDGLGRQSVEILDTMKDEVSVSYRATRASKYLDIPFAIQKIMKQKRSQFGKVIIYEDIIHTLSHTFFRKRFDLNKQDQIRLAYSMFESSEIPQRWVHNLNLYFDAVIVPDSYHVASYKNSGVKLPIFVLPLGLNLKKLLEEPIKKKAHSPFVFANFSTCISRKNHKTLIKVFHEAFGNSPHVLLWINSKYSHEGLFNTLRKEIQDLGATNILLTDRCYDVSEYTQNFHKIDCYVSLSQAEGFSIQPREAMALGIPCIVSDNTAQSTICKSGLVKSIPSSIKEPAYYEHFQDIFGFRYDVDFEESVRALREVYDRYDDYLSQAASLREWASYYDYEKLRPLYKSLIKPQKVVLGKENIIREDVLITTSEALYKKYQAL